MTIIGNKRVSLFKINFLLALVFVETKEGDKTKPDRTKKKSTKILNPDDHHFEFNHKW